MKNKKLMLFIGLLCGVLFADIVFRYARYIMQFLNGDDFFLGMVFVYAEILEETNSYMLFSLGIVLITIILSIIAKSVSRIAISFLTVNFLLGAAFIITTNFVGLPIMYLPLYFVIICAYLLTEVVSLIIMTHNLYKQFNTI